MNLQFKYPELYHRYRSMKERCLNPKHSSYMDYGGRGIKICDRWLEKGSGFKNYSDDILKTLGPPPSNKHHLDRIDNDGNYEPGNLRWSTARENLLNRRYLKPSNTGYKGVTYDKRRNRYMTKISYMDMSYFIGAFFTEAEARAQFDYAWHILNSYSDKLNNWERQEKRRMIREMQLRKAKNAQNHAKHEKALAELHGKA